MAGKYGVKETKEVLDLLLGVVVLETVKELKDGFQASDVLAFLKSEQFEAKLLAAVEGAEEVPEELKDLGIVDGVALGRHAYSLVDSIIDELKSK